MQMYHINIYLLERRMSVIYSPLNTMMFYGVALETTIFIFIVYIPGVNKAFGARPVDIFNLGYILFFNFFLQNARITIFNLLICMGGD